MTVFEIPRRENSHIWPRQEQECYVEPEWCSKRLFDLEKFDGFIHDPCCGTGRICDMAAEAGYGWSCADVTHRGYQHQVNVWDFLSREDHHQNIVCNPPFKIIREFAIHALKISSRKVAMIWLVRTLPAARWLEQTPLKKILFLTPRPSMPPIEVIRRGEKAEGGKQDFCWLIWEHGFNGKPEIGWLRRDSTKP